MVQRSADSGILLSAGDLSTGIAPSRVRRTDSLQACVALDLRFTLDSSPKRHSRV